MVCLRSWCSCTKNGEATTGSRCEKAGDGDRTSGADADADGARALLWTGVARQTFAWKLVRRNVWGVHRPWRVAQDNQIIGTAANGPHEQSQEDGKLVEAAIAVRVATDDVKDGNGFWRRKCSEGRQLEAARSRETFGAARR